MQSCLKHVTCVHQVYNLEKTEHLVQFLPALNNNGCLSLNASILILHSLNHIEEKLHSIF